MPTTFDLFGTLVDADRPGDPAVVVADALEARDVTVPDDWALAYRECHADLPEGRGGSLAVHVADALRSRGVDPDRALVREATVDAFDRPVQHRDGAREAVLAAREHGPVGVLSNCSVPGLVQRVLDRTAFSGAFDAVVSSVDCGWRKPHANAFEAAADTLDTDPGQLVHVGDDHRTDGGVEAVGGRVVLVNDTPLRALPGELEVSAWA